MPTAQVTVFADEMRDAGADWQLIVYGGAMHGFTHEHADRGGRRASRITRASDARSSLAIRAFLAEAFGRPLPGRSPFVTDPSPRPSTDPTALYAVRDGLYAADMLIAAVSGLDFFTWLDAHPGTVDEIAAQFGFHRRPVDVMTTLFVAMGLLERDGARLRTAAPAREHLVAHSPWYLGPYYPKVADRPIARDLIDDPAQRRAGPLRQPPRRGRLAPGDGNRGRSPRSSPRR